VLLVDNNLLSGWRILVVEDEMLIAMMIEDMLADLGCTMVTSAATVDRALALINAQAFDVALLDMNLNGNDSHPVAEALSARGVPFVYSTGNTGQGLRDGCSDRPVLKKPFKYEELAAILTRLKLVQIER
jgi:CheY-like chemotaxis protein